MKTCLFALGMLVLVGCVTAEDESKTCQGYGFKPGSEAFAGCMMDLDNRRSDRRAAVGSAMQSAGNNYSAAMRPVPPMNCTYTGNRYTVRQSCY